MQLQVPVYPLERFSIQNGRDGKTLVAEASDINYRGPRPLYDDACDVGIAIRSHYTGKEVRFYLEGVDKDREGDIAGWRFKLAPDRGNHSTITNVLIIND